MTTPITLPPVDRKELAGIIRGNRYPDREALGYADTLIGSGIFARVAAEAWDEGWLERALWTGNKGQAQLNPYRSGVTK